MFYKININRIEDVQPIRAAAFSHDGEFFALGTNSKSLKIFSLRNILEKQVIFIY